MRQSFAWSNATSRSALLFVRYTGSAHIRCVAESDDSQEASLHPTGPNQLHTMFERHFDEFCDAYDEKYAATCGMFRLDRIHDIGERFLTCGDYRQGVARICCTNAACGHDYFRPFSCKGFYLCPSCR